MITAEDAREITSQWIQSKERKKKEHADKNAKRIQKHIERTDKRIMKLASQGYKEMGLDYPRFASEGMIEAIDQHYKEMGFNVGFGINGSYLEWLY